MKKLRDVIKLHKSSSEIQTDPPSIIGNPLLDTSSPALLMATRDGAEVAPTIGEGRDESDQQRSFNSSNELDHVTFCREVNPSVQVDPNQQARFPPRNDSHIRTRGEAAHQKLIEASEDLRATLKDYLHIPTVPAAHAEIVAPPDEALIISGMVNQEEFGRAVERVLAKQKEQKVGVTSRIANALVKLYPLISLTLSLGTQAVSLGGPLFTPLQCTMNGVSLLISVAHQEQSRSDDFLKQFDRILYQSLRIAEIQKHPTLQINELLLEKSTNLMTSIIHFFKSTLVFFRHDYFYNLGRTLLLGSKIYTDARETLDVAIAEFDQALLLQVTVKILAEGYVTKPVDEHLQKSELLSWLSSSHWEVEAQFASNCKLRAPGTLQWVLDMAEFKAWRLSDCKAGSRSESLWLNGPAGVGKSIIATYIAQVLRAQYPDAAVLYFFCKAGDPLLDNIDQLVRTLAAQLALVIPEARQHFQQLKDKGFKSKSLSFLFSTLVADTLRHLSQKTFIIIDGLDECFGGVSEDGETESPIQVLIEALKKIDAKILVSSRPTPEITHGLWGCPTRRLTFEDSREDIEQYVSMRVSKSRNLQRGFTRLGKEPSVFIAEKSHGNFLWVSIVLSLLERTPSVNTFQVVIETIPKSLSSVYDRVLDKLEVGQTLDVALAILEYVLFSMVPLTLDQLQLALRVLQNEVLDLQVFVESNCGAFLGIVPGKNGPSVQIVHETFRSYITDAAVSKGRCFLPSKSHARLAGACLECVMGPEGKELEPFGDYAVEHWFAHFLKFRSEADAPSDDSVVQALFIKMHRFLTSEGALRQWMQRRCFIVPNPYYDLDTSYADVHDDVLEWLKSDEMTLYCSRLVGSDCLEDSTKAALNWRDTVIKSNSLVFATTIANNMAWVWLNTNWRERELSKMIFIFALTTARILQVVGPSENPNQSFPPYHDPKHEKYRDKPGYTWRCAPSIFAVSGVNKEQLDMLANMGGYNPSIGLHSGNYAFGCSYAKADVVVQCYRSAIDEYPEWWHLHEGLGDWFRCVGDNENALKAYAEAMKHDPKRHPSAPYWELLAEAKKEQGDISGAVNALREGVHTAKKDRIYWYWFQIAKIYEEQKDWESLRSIYQEAIRQHPDNQQYYWCSLANTYESCFDWKGQLDVYFSAIATDPDNTREYSKEIRRLAFSFTRIMLFSPATTVLTTAIMLTTAMGTRTAELAQYQQSLADTYMAARQWDKARALYKAVLEGPCTHDFRNPSDDLGHAYLALGDTTHALAAYYQNYHEDLANGDHSGLSTYGAPAHMLTRNFLAAIRLLKADITKSHSCPGGLPATVIVTWYFNLGLCYEALDRSEEARAAFSNLLSAWQGSEEKNMVVSDGVPIYRSRTRPLVIYGYALEKLGRVEEAKCVYDAAERMFAIATFTGDDEPLMWEHEDCKRALERVSANNSDRKEMPSLLEEVGGMRLELRLSQYYRSNWPGYQERSKTPQYRSRNRYLMFCEEKGQGYSSDQV